MAKAHEGDPGAASALVERWEAESNPYWKAACVRLLAPYAGETSVSSIVEKSAASSFVVERDAAMLALSNLEASAALTAGLSDESRMVWLRASEALLPVLDWESSVFREWVDYVEANADRPVGALRRAELAVADGDAGMARELVFCGLSRSTSEMRLWRSMRQSS